MNDIKEQEISGASESLAAQLKEQLKDYYRNYYKHQLGLPDWESRIESRYHEEVTFAEPGIRKIEDWINYDFRGKRVLIVGAGTGGEAVSFSKRGADIYGIEPNENAVDILRVRAKQNNWNPDIFRTGVAESLPYESDSFDFVYCWTVLEHVQDVEKSIDEMIRVSKKNGVVFIQVPDYRFPYEGHYKIPLLPFMPKWAQKIFLVCLGRPAGFLDSVTFLTAPGLDKLFYKKNIIRIRVFEPQFFIGPGVVNSFLRLFSRFFPITRQQYIFLKKR